MNAWKMPLDRRELVRVLSRMAEACGLPPGAVELALTGDAQISAVNEAHLGCRGPTNILSFPAENGVPGQLLLSVDALRRECLLYGQKPEEHALRLLAHGMAHLAGLNHGPAMERAQQAAEEAGLQALRETRGACGTRDRKENPCSR